MCSYIYEFESCSNSSIIASLFNIIESFFKYPLLFIHLHNSLTSQKSFPFNSQNVYLFRRYINPGIIKVLSSLQLLLIDISINIIKLNPSQIHLQICQILYNSLILTEIDKANIIELIIKTLQHCLKIDTLHDKILMILGEIKKNIFYSKDIFDKIKTIPEFEKVIEIIDSKMLNSIKCIIH